MKKPQVLIQPGYRVFAGNDYLGLANDPRLVEALCQGAEEYGVSTMSSRWALGWRDVHNDLEIALSSFFSTEDTVLLGAAYLGGAIFFEAMKSKGYGHVFCDEISHSNLFFGMQANGFEVIKYKHLDIQDLKNKISKRQSDKFIIATDGVYGISGEVAPLKEINQIAHQYKAPLLVDDSHGAFHLGPTGKGACEQEGVPLEDVVILGSLSKALGTNGGFLTGKAEWVDLFRHSSVVGGTTNSPAAISVASIKALEIINGNESLIEKVRENAKRMREIIKDKNLNIVCSDSNIVAFELADEMEAAALSKAFYENKILIPYFKYPAEPRHNFLRAIARANYLEDDFQAFENVLNDFMK